MLLALDTATATVSVALHDGESTVYRAVSTGPLQHGEQLAGLIAAGLADVGAIRQDLTAIAVGVGPGPYTGLRVGVVTARVLALALEIPAYGVCSLDVLAVEALAAGLEPPFVATMDARRKELFWAAYDDQGRRQGDPQVCTPAELPEDVVRGLVVGAGPVLYPERFTRPALPQAPDAGWLAEALVRESVELLDPEPIYLRRPDAKVPGAPKAVS